MSIKWFLRGDHNRAALFMDESGRYRMALYDARKEHGTSYRHGDTVEQLEQRIRKYLDGLEIPFIEEIMADVDQLFTQLKAGVTKEVVRDNFEKHLVK